MQNKKSWIGYLSVSVSGVALCVYLYTLLVSLFGLYEKSYGKSVYIFDIPLPSICSVAIILVATLLFMLLSKLKRKNIIKSFVPDSKFFIVLYYVLFAAILVFSLYLRIRVMLNGSLYFDNEEYKAIFAAYTQQVDISGSFFSKCFGGLCVFLLKIFGDIYFIPALVNVCLFVASVVLFASVARVLFGRCEALSLFGLMLLLDRTMNFVTDFSGITIYLVIIAFFAFTASYFLELIVSKRPILVKTSFVGLIIGFSVLYHFGCSGFSFEAFTHPMIEDYHISSFFGGIIPVCMLFLFGIISFFYDEMDRISLGAYSFLLILVASFFAKDSSAAYLFMLPSVSVVAGYSIRWLLFKNFAENLNEEIDAPLQVSVTDESISDTTEIQIASETVDKNSNEKDETVILFEEEKTIETPMPIEMPKSEEAPKTEEKPSKSRFLDNPLPLPKRHVKKKIDYAFEPSEKLMKYDVEVRDDDDFDIR